MVDEHRALNITPARPKIRRVKIPRRLKSAER
jgi:hypothetical protein